MAGKLTTKISIIFSCFLIVTLWAVCNDYVFFIVILACVMRLVHFNNKRHQNRFVMLLVLILLQCNALGLEIKHLAQRHNKLALIEFYQLSDHHTS